MDFLFNLIKDHLFVSGCIFMSLIMYGIILNWRRKERQEAEKEVERLNKLLIESDERVRNIANRMEANRGKLNIELMNMERLLVENLREIHEQKKNEDKAS